MKILSVEDVRMGDLYTIENEPISHLDLMERAAGLCFQSIIKKVQKGQKVAVFCGYGNNGGDGLVIGRLLIQQGFDVGIWIMEGNFSDANSINQRRLEGLKALHISHLNETTALPELDPYDCIVDALFGSGISRPLSGLNARLVNHINAAGKPVISIDLPSGLFADKSHKGQTDPIIRANITLSFSPPEIGLFYAENGPYVGEWELLDIGILKEFIEKTSGKDNYTDISDIRSILRLRGKFDHKGTFGHALLLAGSSGKMGACILAAKAALRSGLGLLTAHIPGNGLNILQTSVPECMCRTDTEAHFLSEPGNCANYQAIAIGPGIGMDRKTMNALKVLIQESRVPLILDADAINILGENKTWLAFLPAYSILTPHPKEFERIAGTASNDYERHQRQLELSHKHSVYIILKGAHSCISCPDGSSWFNTTGNPGMATAGSGDVLTGIILGLKAQGYSSFEACLTGVFLHGLAGDFAAGETSPETLIAGDIIEYLGKAFRFIRQD